MVSILNALEEYLRLGLDPVPLRPGLKSPIVRNWPNKSVSSMWRNAPPDANIGIRCGGSLNLAVIDCDEKKSQGTFSRVQKYLSGLGLEPDGYPIVQTASGIGRHIYLRLTKPPHGNYRLLSADFGTGEFRYREGVYVVAPPSIVDSNSYQLLSGDFRRIPELSLEDIEPLFSISKNLKQSGKKYPRISHNALRLLKAVGKDKYLTRSEATQALMTSLVNTGHDFNSIVHLFLTFPATGKFRELHSKDPDNALRWLRYSYEKAMIWSATHESEERQSAKLLLSWAKQRPWPGRTGSTDHAVYLSLLQMSYLASSLSVAASVRNLAQLAGVGRDTASRAMKRLREVGLVELEIPATAEMASVYHLKGDFLNRTLPHTEGNDKCPTYFHHDAFRHGGLNKTGAMIYEYLRMQPATQEQIVEYTGKSKKTVRKYLTEKFHLVDIITRETISMVKKENGKWIALEVDLDRVAEILGKKGKGEKDKRKFEQERLMHNRALKNYADRRNWS